MVSKISKEKKAEYDRRWHAMQEAKKKGIPFEQYLKEHPHIQFKHIDPLLVREKPKQKTQITQTITPTQIQPEDNDSWHKINTIHAVKNIRQKFIDEKKQVDEILTAIIDNENVLLEGYTGTAKTFLLEQIAKEVGTPIRVLNMQVDTASDAIKGKFNLDKEGKIIWLDGAITQAMKNGELLVIEEINFIQPEISSILYSITDYRRNIVLDEKEHEIIKAHPNFRIVATRNPDYQGTNRLNPALENRFTVQFFMDYLNWQNESALIVSRYNLDKDIANVLCKTAHKIRAQREEFDNDLSTRVVEACARRIKAGTNLNRAFDITILPIIAKDGDNRRKARVILDTLIREDKLTKGVKNGV